MVIETVVEELDKFVYYLSHKNANANTIMMDSEEIAGDLFFELVKGFDYYKDKDLTMPQMLAVIRRMMDNRISELVYKHYVTHRKNGLNYIPIDEIGEGENDDGYVVNISVKAVVSVSVTKASELPEEALESKDRVTETLALLSAEGLAVANALIYGNDLLGMQLLLAGQRAAFVYKGGGRVEPKPRHVSDAIGMPEDIVAAAFKEIKLAYAEVCK